MVSKVKFSFSKKERDKPFRQLTVAHTDAVVCLVVVVVVVNVEVLVVVPFLIKSIKI